MPTELGAKMTEANVKYCKCGNRIYGDAECPICAILEGKAKE